MELLSDLDENDWEKVPAMPIWLNDKKPENFGEANGKIKARDYYTILWDKFVNGDVDFPPAFALAKRRY